MKKKLIISIILVAVFCSSIFLLASCNKGMSDEALDSILTQLKYQLKNNSQIAKVPTSITQLDENDNEQTSNIKWEVVGSSAVSLADADANGDRAVNVPEARTEDINFTLKATLVDKDNNPYQNKDGNPFVAEFAQSYAKTGYSVLARQSFLNKTVSAPVAGTNYKLAFYHGAMYEVYYAKGGMSGKYLATSTAFGEAANATIETATDGFYLKVGDKYVTLTGTLSKNSNGNIVPKATISLADTGSTVFNVAEKNILIASVPCSGEGITNQIEKFVLGTYGTKYTTISTSSYFYISGKDNAAALDTSQWVCRLCTTEEIEMPAFTKPTEPADIIAAVKSIPANDYLPGGKYVLRGIVSEHIDTSNLTGSNSNVTLNMTVGNETVQCYRLTSATLPAIGTEIEVTGYLVNYKKDATTPAIVEFAEGATYTVVNAVVESNVDKVAVADVAVDTPYVIAIQNKSSLSKEYYLGTALYASYYREPIFDVLAAPKFYLEQTEGGYKVYCLENSAKKYLGAKVNGSNINLVVDDSTAILVWKLDENGLSVHSDKKDFYIAQRQDKDRIGLYTLADDVYPGFLATVKEDKSTAQIVATPDDNAEIVLNKTSGKAGETFTFTINYDDTKFKLKSVKVNGENAPEPDTHGVYTITINASVMTVEVVVTDINEETPTTATFDFASVAYKSTYAFSADEAQKYFKGLDTNDILLLATTSFVYGKGGSSDAWANATNMLKVGKSKTAGQIVLTFNASVKKVEISCFAYKSQNSTVKVNNSDAQSAAAWNDAHTPGTLTFVLDTASNVVTIETSERVYMLSLTVHFGEGSNNEAKIGTTEYPTLAEAITAAKAASGEVTITLLKDVTSGGIALWAEDQANIVLDLNNHTLTLKEPPVGSNGYKTQGLHLEKGNTFVIKNGTVTSVKNSGIKMLVQNYCNLTLDNVTLDGSNLDAVDKAYTLSNCFGTTVIRNGSVVKARSANDIAFDVWFSTPYSGGVTVTVETGCTVNGTIEYGTASDVTGTDWVSKTVLNLPAGDFQISYVGAATEQNSTINKAQA